MPQHACSTPAARRNTPQHAAARRNALQHAAPPIQTSRKPSPPATCDAPRPQDYLGDGDFVRPLMQQLTDAELLSNEAVQRAARNLRSHAESPGAEVWRMRMRHRDLKQMMGCVQCNLCRVHGTVMCLGLGATMQARAALQPAALSRAYHMRHQVVEAAA